MSVVVRPVDRETWRRLAPGFRDYNYRQIWEFGVACAARVGARSEHIGVYEGGDVLALADVRVKSIPLLGTGIAYINGGPLVRRDDGCDAERLGKALSALQTEYVHRRALLLRVAPPPASTERVAALAAAFDACNYLPADRVSPHRTMLVNLSAPLADIRKRLRQKWRNCLNAAERNDLLVRASINGDTFAAFCQLYGELLARKQFAVDLDAWFYAQVQERLIDDERFEVTLAEHNGHLVAGHVASTLGDTCVYLLGAANEQGLRQKASYLLQWNVLVRARERGCRWYDLGGIDPENNPGVYAFKAGLGGVEVTAPGPFEIAPTSLSRHIVRGAERIYRGLRYFRRRVG